MHCTHINLTDKFRLSVVLLNIIILLQYISYRYCHLYLKQKEEEVQHKRDVTKDGHVGIRQEIKGHINLKAKIPSVLGKTAFSFVSVG